MYSEINKNAVDRIREDIFRGKLVHYQSPDDDDDEDEDDDEFNIDELEDFYSEDDDSDDDEDEDDGEYDEDSDEPILISKSPNELKLKYDHFSKLYGPYLVVRYGDSKNVLDTRVPCLVFPHDVSYVKHIKGTDLIVAGTIGYDRNSCFDLANSKTPNRVYDLEKRKPLLPPEWYLVGRLSDDLLLFYDDSRFVVFNIPMKDCIACDVGQVGKYLSIRRVYENWYIVSTNKEEIGTLEYSLINPIEGKGYRFADDRHFDDLSNIMGVTYRPESTSFLIDTFSGRFEITVTGSVCQIVKSF